VYLSPPKQILRYVQGTVDYGLDYRRGDGMRLGGYTNSDWAGCASDKKSTSGLLQIGFGSCVVVQLKAKVGCFELFRG